VASSRETTPSGVKVWTLTMRPPAIVHGVVSSEDVLLSGNGSLQDPSEITVKECQAMQDFPTKHSDPGRGNG
jgi:hypothetical protein